MHIYAYTHTHTGIVMNPSKKKNKVLNNVTRNPIEKVVCVCVRVLVCESLTEEMTFRVKSEVLTRSYPDKTRQKSIPGIEK